MDIDIPKCVYDYTQMWINMDMTRPKCGYVYIQLWINVDMTYPNGDIDIPKCR